MTKLIANSLCVNDLFTSISGEVGGFPQGSLCFFIRLAGCNLRCKFCDAKETFKMESDQNISIKQIFDQIKRSGLKLVVITGGEPFLQLGASFYILIDLLIEEGISISIETNGSFLTPSNLIDKVTIVMDYKLNYIDSMKFCNFLNLKSTDFVKFVISSKMGMAFATSIQKELQKAGCLARFAYSPLLPDIKNLHPQELLLKLYSNSKIVLQGFKDFKVDGILNIQIHKLINQP